MLYLDVVALFLFAGSTDHNFLSICRLSSSGDLLIQIVCNPGTLTLCYRKIDSSKEGNKRGERGGGRPSSWSKFYYTFPARLSHVLLSSHPYPPLRLTSVHKTTRESSASRNPLLRLPSDDRKVRTLTHTFTPRVILTVMGRCMHLSSYTEIS